MSKRHVVHCELCGGTFTRYSNVAPKNCQQSRVERPDECWSNREGTPYADCIASFRVKSTSPGSFEVRLRLVKELGPLLAQGVDPAVKYIATLSDPDLQVLLRTAAPAMRTTISDLLSRAKVTPGTPRFPERSFRLDPNLPEDIFNRLQAFQTRLETRLRRLLEAGHERSPKYVHKTMYPVVRFARHLAAKGVTRWDTVRKRDVVAYLEATPTAEPGHIDRFLKQLREHLPFRETRGRKGSYTKGSRLRHLTPPQVIAPEELTAELRRIRRTRSDAEYLLAWLICRMGMAAASAHEMTLDRIAVNKHGELVIRPAKAWVKVPKAEAAAFERLLAEVAPDWRRLPPESLHFVLIFERHIPQINNFTQDVLRGRVQVMRASGIYAAMLAGKVDRTTLNRTMGVSFPYLAKIETLLSADLHMRLDPELVKERNLHIVGAVKNG